MVVRRRPGRACAGPARGPARVGGSAGVRGQGLGERQVEVHRARREPDGGRDRPPDGRPHLRRRAPDGGREPHGRTEHPDLRHGLARPRADQLGGPVRGERQQRHPRVRGLQHGREEVRRGRARGRGHRHRPSRRQRQPERQEPGRALVDADVQPQAPGGVRGVQGERERRVARARAQHGVGDPARHQLVDDRARHLRRRVHRWFTAIIACSSRGARPHHRSRQRVLLEHRERRLAEVQPAGREEVQPDVVRGRRGEPRLGPRPDPVQHGLRRVEQGADVRVERSVGPLPHDPAARPGVEAGGELGVGGEQVEARRARGRPRSPRRAAAWPPPPGAARRSAAGTSTPARSAAPPARAWPPPAPTRRPRCRCPRRPRSAAR